MTEAQQIRAQVYERAMAGDKGMLALMSEIESVSWKLESARDSVKSYAQSIQRRVEYTLETLDGTRNGSMEDLQGVAASYDVAIARVKELEERVEGLTRVASHMIGEEA